MIEFLEFTSRDEASHRLSQLLLETLSAAINEKNSASLVVSGGSTPKPMFQELSSQKLAWKKVTVIPSDERCVPLDHPDSNEAMIARELQQDQAVDLNLFSYVDLSQDPDESMANINRRLGTLPLPFDSVVLGMGDDGHTASLFPDSPDIDTALLSDQLCIRQSIPRLPVDRLSLTLKALLNAKSVHLFFFGSEKRAVYEKAAKAGETAEYPVRGILHQTQTPVTVWWAE